MSAAAALPPGPPLSHRRQELAWVLRPEWLMELARRTCGDVATLHLPLGRAVLVSDPEALRTIFTGDPDLLRAGEGNAPLEPVIGPSSILRLDGERHLRRRRLVLPPFHGARLQAYAGAMTELTAGEMAGWPLGRAFALEPRMRAITLAVIVRVVFGIDDAGRAARAQQLIPRLLPDGVLSQLLLFPALRQDVGPRSPWGRFLAARAQVDALLYEEIARRRADPGVADRDDVLSLLLSARDEDGVPLTDGELRDELMTLLLAGHETTATALAWTFELLGRRPDALERATAEARGGQAPTPYIDAVIAETLRLKPPLPMAVRRLADELELAGHRLPAGTRVAPSIYLTHRRPDLYPEPLAFRPERFLGGDGAERTYGWLPFGGGVRRCVGAAFAQLELRTVLRTVLGSLDVRPASSRPERTRRRAVVLTPSRGARVRVTRPG